MLIVANWKMNCLKAPALELVSSLKAADSKNNEVVICPPFTLLSIIAESLKNTPIKLGAQDCHIEEKGAFTGDISPSMLADIGAKYVIVGHSERRKQHNESCQVIKSKAIAAAKSNLIPIICIGETKEEREQGLTEKVLTKQLQDSIPDLTPDKMVIAYEPIWAIGTGVTAKTSEIEHAHKFIASKTKARILYGGSANELNCNEICAVPYVSGLLVGGASLEAAKFIKIMAV